MIFSEDDVRDREEDGTVEVIQLKNENKNLIDYEDTKELNTMREKIHRYNRFIVTQDVKLEVPSEVVDGLNFRRQTFLYHFFNSDSRYTRYDDNDYDSSDDNYNIISTSNPLNRTISIRKLAVKRSFNNNRMPRPRKKDSEKVVKIYIILSKSIYQNFENKNVKISTYIDQLLKVSLASSTNAYNNIAQSSVQQSYNLDGGLHSF